MGLWKDKTRTPQLWSYSFQFQGKTYASRGFVTKAAAREAREERRRLVRAQSASQPTPGGTDFRTVASLYLDWAERRFAEKTFKYKRYVYQQFLAHHGNLEVAAITPQHLHSYLDTRRSNHNYNCHRKDLGALFTHARRVLHVITYNPCWDLDKMPHRPAEKTVPLEEDVLRLIVAADPATDERDLVLTILHTLARVDEILRLRWEDVNFERRTVTRYTRKRKGGSYQPIVCHMNRDLYEIMRHRWEARSQNDWCFFNPKTADRYHHRPKLMPSLCRRAGIRPTFGFHALRHFAATLLNDSEKISTATISGILGHTNKQTTEIYLHAVERSQVQAMQQLEGRFNLVAGAGCGSASNHPQPTARGAQGK